MNELIDKYLKNLKILKKPYTDKAVIKETLISDNIALHIPQWKYLDKSNTEIISKNHGLIIWGKDTSTYIQYGNEINTFSKNIFAVLEEIDTQIKESNAQSPLFYTGILAYELTNYIENIPKADPFYDLPDYYFVFPGNTFMIDHTKHEIYEFYMEDSISLPEPIDAGKIEKNNLLINESKPDYLGKIKQIRDLIYNGEVYQINYTIRVSREIRQSGKEFFENFYKINPAPFSFYAHLPHCEIISNSPERFFYLENDKILTQPIKGTIKRTENKVENEALKQKLTTSEKDCAELSMIVDLLRNDISKVCEPGSVIVLKHKELKAFANVFHLISTIQGKLNNTETFVDLLKAVFPGGSITGCPKIAAMKYIAQLEKHERSFYTGSFFIRFPQKNSFDSNILIRTAIKKDNAVHFQAGGGIVIDSDPEGEYNECLTKASSFLKVLDECHEK